MVDLFVSASQFESFDECARRWWLQKVFGAPEMDRGYFTFGTVLHTVIERWMRADDLGRDPKTGRTVNLYPEGWTQEIDREGRIATVSMVEADLIKRLVKEAISQGVLVRHPERQIELSFTRYLLSLKYQKEITRVHITGFIDLAHAEGIDDHKSTSNMRWAKSPAQLRKNPQMLIYASEWFNMQAESGMEVTDDMECRIAHNVFCKDPQDFRVKRTSTVITFGDVREFYETRWKSVLRGMVKTKQAKNWYEIPPPENTAATCNKYGGCSFRSVCGKRETLRSYVKRVNGIRERSNQETEVET